MTDIPESAESIILRFRDGAAEPASGCRVDLDREVVVAVGTEGASREIPFADLKAVFFRRDPSTGQADFHEPDGKTISVEFQDGEVIRGISPEYRPDRKGFVIFPLDRSKNDRIFVVQSAIVSIDIEKF